MLLDNPKHSIRNLFPNGCPYLFWQLSLSEEPHAKHPQSLSFRAHPQHGHHDILMQISDAGPPLLPLKAAFRFGQSFTALRAEGIPAPGGALCRRVQRCGGSKAQMPESSPADAQVVSSRFHLFEET